MTQINRGSPQKNEKHKKEPNGNFRVKDITEMKNSLDGFSSRFEMAEDRISKSDNRLIKNDQLEKRDKSLKMNRASSHFWNKNQVPIYMS